MNAKKAKALRKATGYDKQARQQKPKYVDVKHRRLNSSGKVEVNVSVVLDPESPKAKYKAAKRAA